MLLSFFNYSCPKMILNFITNSYPPTEHIYSLSLCISGAVLNFASLLQWGHLCFEQRECDALCNFLLNASSALKPPNTVLFACLGVSHLECCCLFLWTVFIFVGKIYRFMARVKIFLPHPNNSKTTNTGWRIILTVLMSERVHL